MTPTVAIDCQNGRLPAGNGYAVVAVDVIRATTTAVTAAAGGRRCFPVPSLPAAMALSERLTQPLLAGELEGIQPEGFHLQNSPWELERQNGSDRPVILLSTSGTKLMFDAAGRDHAYAACLRNHSAQASELGARHERVLLLGAPSRGEFREEDQLCCARIGAALVTAGFTVENEPTARVIDRWHDAADDAFLGGKSARYLRESGQQHDLEFILRHVDDLTAVFMLDGSEVVARAAPESARAGSAG
jgi:2-phosphosulfolactate phosphatase